MKQHKTNLPICIINTAIGDFQLDVRPNKNYRNEIIISDKRFDLPRGICFDDVVELKIYQGHPPMGMIKYMEHQTDGDCITKSHLIIFREHSFNRGFYCMDFT